MLAAKSLSAPDPQGSSDHGAWSLGVKVGVHMLQGAEESCLDGSHLPVGLVEGIKQEQNGADAYHRAKDQGVPSLPQIDSLDEIVDSWETI